MSEMKHYLANWPVKHGGTLHMPGEDAEPLELSDKEAAPLLAVNAITLIEGASSAINPNELTEEQKLAEVLNAIDLLDLSNADNVIASGAPDAKVLSEKVGFTVSATLRDQAWAAFQAKGNN